jgi:c-di-GMP-binding flagellar brake protein YcgR
MQAGLQHPSTAAASAPALDDYRVTDATERVALLVDLRDSAAPVLMHAPGGAALRTRLWVVDAAASRLAFAVAAADLPSPHLEPLLDADEVTALAHPGHVKLQFDLHGLVLVRGTASAVLQCALPDEVLRFQRRETFRVCPPVSSPVAYLRHPSIPDMSLALRVLDLSLGGCALRLPDDVPMLAPGTRLGGVTIELDLSTRLRVELTLQHVTYFGHSDETGSVGAPLSADGDRGIDGTGGARLGCEWRLERPGDQRALQRWIDHAQVRQRMSQRAARQAVPRASAPTPAAGLQTGQAGTAGDD